MSECTPRFADFNDYLEKTPNHLLFDSMINRALIALICFGSAILCFSFAIAHPNYHEAGIWMPAIATLLMMFAALKGSQAVDILQKLLLHKK